MSDREIENNMNEELNNNINVNNIRENDYVGGGIDGNKKETKHQKFRVQCVNTNGLQVKKRGGGFQEFCQEMVKHQIDLSCNSEINLDTTKLKVKEMIHKTGQTIFNNKFCCKMSSSTIRTKNFYKPGDTMIMTVGNYSGRIIRRGSNIM